MCKFDDERIEKLLRALKTWSTSDDSVKGVALVGSWDAVARQHAEADADLVLLVDDPDRFRRESGWMAEIDWSSAGLGPGRWTECDYRGACSRHLRFDDGAAVEVSFVASGWAATDPISPATRRIAGNGIRVVHDPEGLLGRLVAAL